MRQELSSQSIVRRLVRFCQAAAAALAIVAGDAVAQTPDTPRLSDLPGMTPEARAEFLRSFQPTRHGSNCPAAAAAFDRYARTGEWSPAAREGVAGGGWANCGAPEVEADLDSIIARVAAGGHGYHVVVYATDGGSRNHYANLVNIDGVVYYVDVFTNPPAFSDNPRSYLNWATHFEYSTDFRPRRVPEGATPSCPGGGGGASSMIAPCTGPDGCEASAFAAAPAIRDAGDYLAALREIAGPRPMTRVNFDTGACPAPIDGGGAGRSYGDPHIRTFDGLEYSFQTVGEFILVRSKDGFEVQTRQEQVPGRDLSLNTAAAIRVGESRLVFYAVPRDGGARILLDGTPVGKIRKKGLSIDDATLTQRGDDAFLVEFSTGHSVRIDFLEFFGMKFLNATVASPPSFPQFYSGLLGDRDGEASNDLRLSGGGVIKEDQSTYDRAAVLAGRFAPGAPLDRLASAYYDDLYRRFAASWRVTADTSLFDYAPGESPESFVRPGFPARYLTLADADAAAIGDAAAACEAAGVPAELMNGCVFDVAATGETGFAEALARAALDRARGRAERELRRRLPGVPRLP